MKARLLGNRRKVLEAYCRGKDVLDIGCIGGIGPDKDKFTHDAIRAVARKTVGIDINREAVERYRAKGYDVRCADARDPGLNEKFDVVFAGEVIEHIEDQMSFLKGVKHLLKPHGIFIVSTPNAHDVAHHLNRVLRRMDDDYARCRDIGHVVMHSYGTLRLLLERAGFEMLEYYYVNSICLTGRRKAMGIITRAFPDFGESLLMVARPR